MSISLADCVLSKLYRDTEHNIEHKSSAFWQVYLQRASYNNSNFIVITESPPDDSLRRVDIFVKRYDEGHDTLNALILIECKRPRGSAKDVEYQVAEAARRCMETHNLSSMYAITTIGVRFRVWKITDDLVLRPFFGRDTLASKKEYIYTESEEGYFLVWVVEHIKENFPLAKAPTVPSQEMKGDWQNEVNIWRKRPRGEWQRKWLTKW